MIQNFDKSDAYLSWEANKKKARQLEAVIEEESDMDELGESAAKLSVICE